MDIQIIKSVIYISKIKVNNYVFLIMKLKHWKYSEAESLIYIYFQISQIHL